MDGDPEVFWSVHIFIFIISLIFSAFFSSAEFSLTTLSKIRLKEMLVEGIKNADKVDKILSNTNKLTVSLKFGNKIFQFAAMVMSYKLTVFFISDKFLVTMGSGLITVLLILIFCEMFPKNIAGRSSDKASLVFAAPVLFIMKIFTPFVFIINKVSGFFVMLTGGDKFKKLPAVTEAEILTMINIGQQEGVLEDGEKQMISNVFSFGDFKARDVMVPRPDITAVEIDAVYEEIMQIFKEEGYSRLPVYEDTPDTIIGILYLKDIAFVKKEDFDIKTCMREPFYTYESKPTAALFSVMKSKGISMAIVLDEYGGTAGLVTTQDFIEEIVGEIADEYDDLKSEIEVVKEDEYIVDGGTRLETVNDMLGVRLESEDFDSIGGYIMGTLGRIPNEGDELSVDEVRFKVESIDKNRIDKVRIYT